MKQSRRQRLRRRRQLSSLRRNVGFAVGGAVLVTIVLIAMGPGLPSKSGGTVDSLPPIEVPERHARPYADGKTLGPADAAVVIEEYSDFG